MADDQGEKTEAPSQHRIDESRKKGEVASSKELNSVIILAGALSVLIFSSIWIFEILSEYIEWLYTLDVRTAYTQELGGRILVKSLAAAGKSIAPVFMSSVILGFLSQVMQIGILYAPDVLQLKFDRVNPINGMKRIFSKKAIVEVFKSVFKFTVVVSITYYILEDKMNSFSGFLHTDAQQALSFGRTMALQLGLAILIGLFVVALMDFAWEKYSYFEKLKMTKQQLKEENKDREGNPEIKQKIRAIQREMSQKRMMAEVSKADVIVTNPTHISVAIRYDSATMIAPAVTAKGTDHVALKMREIAKSHDIPIVENVPLARALNKTVKVGHGVPRTLYKAVAEILAFVYKLRRKKKALQ